MLTAMPSDAASSVSADLAKPRGSASFFTKLSALALGHPLGRILLCALSGTLLFLACADFDIWPLCWLGMVPLLWVLLDRDGRPRTKHPFLYGMVTGILANGGGFYWIVGLLQRFGNIPFVAAAPLFFLLIAYQALTFGLFASILCRLRSQLGIKVTFLAPLCWVACELCVPYVFPWYLSITQAWVPTVIQIADITGPLGVSFLLVLSNGALFDLFHALHRLRTEKRPDSERRFRSQLSAPLTAAFLIVLALGYGVVRIHQVNQARAAAEKIKVGVVQANIGINEKFVPGLREQQHALHTQLSRELTARGADLIMWPESSYSYPLLRPVRGDFPTGDPRRVQAGFDTPILFGALTVKRTTDGEFTPYNTALLYDKNGQTQGSFDKNFLLIFGEYLPFASELGFLRRLIPAISNFARGTTTTTFPLTLRGKQYALGPMICYEDIIPAFGRRLFADKTPPNLLLNITNDAWFGATSEPYEHLALAVFRAVEHRVDLIRAVNTGVSAFIDATGRVYQKGPSVDPTLQPGVKPVTLLEEAALMQPGGLYQQLGETFGSGCLVLVLLFGVLARQRAGLPVRWGMLLLGAVVLHGAVLLGALLSPSAPFSAFYAALLHRDEAAVPDSQLFAATWQLIVLLMVAGAGLGALLKRQTAAASHSENGTHAAGRLELLAATALVVVVPVVLLGRMEGNTGAVVILGGLCVLSAFVTQRLVPAQRSQNP